MQSGRKLQPDSPRELRRYEALLEMADLMVHLRSLPELFHELAQRIQKAVDFQLLNFSLHNPRHNRMDMHLWEGELVSDFPTEVPVAESVSGWVWEQQKPSLFRDLNYETRFPLVLDPLANTRVPNVFHDAADDGGAANGVNDALLKWRWPGNVRELEYFVERAVILTEGSTCVRPWRN